MCVLCYSEDYFRKVLKVWSLVYFWVWVRWLGVGIYVFINYVVEVILFMIVIVDGEEGVFCKSLWNLKGVIGKKLVV